jgi:hypothetical protein
MQLLCVLLFALLALASATTVESRTYTCAFVVTPDVILSSFGMYAVTYDPNTIKLSRVSPSDVDSVTQSLSTHCTTPLVFTSFERRVLDCTTDCPVETPTYVDVTLVKVN